MIARSRVLVRFAFALATVLTALVLPAHAASAHASVVSSDPADGAVVVEAPATFSIRFSERVDPDLASLTLTTNSEQPVALAGLRTGSGGSELVADLPTLEKGVYRIAYKVRDPVDLHAVAGTIVFGVGDVSIDKVGGVATAAPRPVDVALRWLERIGMALFIGAAVLALAVLPRLGDEVAAVRQALRIAAAGAVLQMVALVGLFVREVVDIGSPYGRTAGRLVTSASFGRRIVAGLLVAAALVVLTRLLRPLITPQLLRRWRTGRLEELGVALAVMVVAACIIVSLAGHASTGGSFALGALVRLVHLLAMGAWAGGVAGAVLVRPDVVRPARLIAVFSRVALLAMVLLVVTGLLLSGREVATVTALLTSWFGRLLLVKLGLVALAGVWGVRHALAVGKGRPIRRRGLRIEGAIALLIVGGGAALSTTAPAVGAYYGKTASATPPPAAINIDDVVVKLSMRPNRPGANLLTATVASTRRPEPAPIAGVTVDFRPLLVDGGLPIKVQAPAPVDGVADFGQLQIPVAGPYQVEVQVDRPGAPLKLSILQWNVDSAQAPRAETVVSDARIGPFTGVAAAVVAVVGLALVVVTWRRRLVSPPEQQPAEVAPAATPGASPKS